MKRELILGKIKKAALRDKRKRLDPRYIRAMAFLTAKGFLFTNQRFHKGANTRLQIEDAIWAGKNLEPRILEVLPAAVLRLEGHFDFDPTKHPALAQTMADLKNGKARGQDFLGVPYDKLKVWVNFKLRDGRVKTLEERKITKTFRLKPQIVQRLRNLAAESHTNETAIIEEFLRDK